MSRIAPTSRAAPPVRAEAKKKAAVAAKASAPDTFKAGSAKKLEPLRPATSAVRFVADFERGLHLSRESYALRAENMKASAVSFFRATPSLFFYDLRHAYDAPLLGRPAPKVDIGGDTHLGNFGVIRGPRPERQAVWALNDFDQAGKGSPEADLERLATSAVLTARAKNYSPSEQRELVKKIAKAYVQGVEKGGPGYIDSKYAKGYVQDVLDRANTQTRHDLLREWTHDGKFRETADLKPLSASESASLKTAVEAYGATLGHDAPVKHPLQVLDMARRLNAGGSTLGLDRFYVLVAGVDGKRARILELKQFPPPAVDGSSPDLSQAKPAEVVKLAAELTGFKSPLLGSAQIDGKPMLVRELEPEKVRVDPRELSGKQLSDLAEQAAAMLARSHGHKRELLQWLGDDKKALEHNLADFAQRYANQVQADFKAYVHG